MDIQKIMSTVDHTLLAPAATWEDIKAVCDDALKYQTASVCIPPSFVREAAEYLDGKMTVCTVIGFPNGYQTTEVKCFETMDAVQNGANEIDMVINIGLLRSKQYAAVLDEIKKIKKICGDRVLKVIVETCLLNENEKREMCRLVMDSGADFIKTSTGFSSGGATFEDISLFEEEIKGRIGIKAAGGIRSFEDAERFLSLGATRLGTSRLVAILKNNKNANSGY